MHNFGKQRMLQEATGGLGDAGLFVPLALALVIENGFNLRGIFATAGLFYILAGSYFKIPMPVQPLKAMAAIALATGLSPEVVHLAGLQFGIVILMLLIPGVARTIEKLFPLPVVRGIQLAIGIILVKRGAFMMAGELPVALLAAAVLAGTYLLIRPLPPLLPLLVLGTVIALISGNPGSLPVNGVEQRLFLPPEDLKGFLFPLTALVIPQLGLTLGNSVMATVRTAKDLFGGVSEKVTIRNLAASIGAGNIVSAFLGGLPMCHGSGGLTAHYRFGARTNRGTAIAGALFLLVALLPADQARRLLSSFPLPFLGLSLAIVGVFHCLLAREMLFRGRHATAALVTALSSVLTGNLTAGVALGFVAFKVEELLILLLARRRSVNVD